MSVHLDGELFLSAQRKWTSHLALRSRGFNRYMYVNVSLNLSHRQPIYMAIYFSTFVLFRQSRTCDDCGFVFSGIPFYSMRSHRRPLPAGTTYKISIIRNSTQQFVLSHRRSRTLIALLAWNIRSGLAVPIASQVIVQFVCENKSCKIYYAKNKSSEIY